ncbi:RNA polymerase sigma factor [Kordiimonas pumila]|uniref:RNA polymerase sigma factor n=1 Tax=Kordiimonas pumila TaxID=2161677 RepID=A0ABV7D5R4_9PROT|nr:sigma-70 family RNA polymerase sigma factor [Kordiimonas pumila]
MKTDTLFEKQYRKYGPEVQNFIARYVGNYSVAEDIMHEVFIKAYQAYQEKHIDNPRAYLFAAARNHSLNHLRQQSNHRRHSTVEFDELIHAHERPSEDTRIEARNELQLVIKAIRTLPPRAQKAFILNRVYRFSYKEVGEKMGISPRTVENHVAKGLLACTKFMVDYTSHDDQATGDNVTSLAEHRSRLRS